MTADTATTLRRSFKPQWVFAIALGSAVGWGAFILPFDWMTAGGLAGTLLGFLVGGAMIAVIALSYGAVIRALPVTGGGVAFAFAALGRTHAFIAGWCLTLGYAGIVALNASAVALVFRVTVPDLVMRGRLYSIAGWDIYLPEVIISSLFLVAFAWINIRGVELSGRFQFLACIFMLAAVVFIIVGAVIQWAANDLPLAPGFPEGVSPLAAVATIVAFAPWAFVGFDNVPQLAGEFKFSPRKALALLLWGVSAATFIYMVMMLSTSIAVGRSHGDFASSAWPPAEAITELLGPVGLLLMVVAVSMGVLTGLNGFFISTSRVLLTMGRMRMLPTAFARLSPRFRTPVAGVLATTVLCLIAPWFGRAALSWVVDMTSVGIAIAYFYTCYCALRIGRTGRVRGMAAAQARSNRLTLIGGGGCLIAISFLLILLFPGSPGALSRPSLVALGCWIVLGSFFYWIRRRSFTSHSDDVLEREVFASTQ